MPSWRFLREATMSETELDPSERLRDWVIGDRGGESGSSGESELGDARKGRLRAHEASMACFSGDIS